jgi:hypothetical protein
VVNFHPLFNNSIIPLDTFDATAARYREDADDAIAAKGRMADVDGAVDGAVAATVAKYHEDGAGATAAKSHAETVVDDAAATVAKYHEDAVAAIDPKIDHYAYNSPAFK